MKSDTKLDLHLKAFSANLLSSIAIMIVAIAVGIRVDYSALRVQWSVGKIPQ